MNTSTYKIIGRTNPWIAQRDQIFKGKCEITIAEGLSLKEAQQKLTSFYNEDNETSYNNWGLVVSHSNGQASSYNDGTRCYEYDSRIYSIEEED